MSSDLKRRELTQRQREVLSGVRRGLANKEIAHELGVGTDDVKRIVSRLLAWFDAPNRTALAQAAAPGHPDSAGFDLEFLELFDEVPLAILATLGPDHVPSFANRAAHSAIPVRPDLPLVGTPLRVALSGVECEEFLSLVQTSFRTGDVGVANKVRFGQRGGQPTDVVYLDVRVEPVHEREAKVLGVLVFARSVDAGDMRRTTLAVV